MEGESNRPVCEITKYYLGNPPLKSGFLKFFEAFLIEAANLNMDFYRVSSRKSLSRNWVSGSVFWCPGNPETQSFCTLPTRLL